jgi:hypothetical protein
MPKDWHKSKMFLHVQRTQTLRIDNPYIFQKIIWIKCAPIFFLIEKDFNIDD